jgi:hypothetical protein
MHSSKLETVTGNGLSYLRLLNITPRNKLGVYIIVMKTVKIFYFFSKFRLFSQ